MKLLVLDRDGVINADSPDFIRNPDDWVPLAGSLEAIARLHQGGWAVAVASNQSGVGRGYFDEETLSAIHRKMLDRVRAAGGEIQRIVYCPHLPDAGCPCRKPRPGLLNQLGTIFGKPASEMIVVGDSRRDLEAAWAVGARALLVRTGNGAQTEAGLAPDEPVEVFDDLASVSENLLRGEPV